MLTKLITFGDHFLGAMRDKQGSHSLTKWCALAVVWVYLITSIRFTDRENLVAALGVHAGLILSLFFTHKYYKNKTNNAHPEGQNNNEAGAQ